MKHYWNIEGTFLNPATEIRRVLLERVRVGLQLNTPTGKAFTIKSIDSNRLVFWVGTGFPVYLKLDCINDLVNVFQQLPEGQWMRIGASHEKAVPVSLDYILQKYSGGTSVASYFGPLLEYVKVAEINRTRPARIRLTILK